MVFNMREYSGLIKGLDIDIIYSGPMWDDGIKGIAEMVKTHLENDEIPGSAARRVFSVFIEQVTNVLMYSAEKEKYVMPGDETVEVSTGMLVLGQKGSKYFIQTGNVIRSERAGFIKDSIDHLNSLDKEELRMYRRERLNSVNDNAESKGAGLGLIEIAKRATAPITYSFEPTDENSVYFTLYVEIDQEARKAGA